MQLFVRVDGRTLVLDASPESSLCDLGLQVGVAAASALHHKSSSSSSLGNCRIGAAWTARTPTCSWPAARPAWRTPAAWRSWACARRTP